MAEHRDQKPAWEKPLGPSSKAPGGALARGVAAFRTLLPLGRSRFERLLAKALDEATRQNDGFFLHGFAARRALGSELVIDIDPRVLKFRLKHRQSRRGRSSYIEDCFIGAGHGSPCSNRSMSRRRIARSSRSSSRTSIM